MRGPQSHPGGQAPPLRDQDSSVSAEHSLQGPGLGSTATPSVLRDDSRQYQLATTYKNLRFPAYLPWKGSPVRAENPVPDTQGALGKIRPEDEQAPGLRQTPRKPDLETGCGGAGGGRRESPPSRTLACRVTSADVGSDPASAPVQLFDRQQTTSPLQTFVSSPVNWGCSPALRMLPSRVPDTARPSQPTQPSLPPSWAGGRRPCPHPGDGHTAPGRGVSFLRPCTRPSPPSSRNEVPSPHSTAR